MASFNSLSLKSKSLYWEDSAEISLAALTGSAMKNDLAAVFSLFLSRLRPYVIFASALASKRGFVLTPENRSL